MNFGVCADGKGMSVVARPYPLPTLRRLFPSKYWCILWCAGEVSLLEVEVGLGSLVPASVSCFIIVKAGYDEICGAFFFWFGSVVAWVFLSSLFFSWFFLFLFWFDGFFFSFFGRGGRGSDLGMPLETAVAVFFFVSRGSRVGKAEEQSGRVGSPRTKRRS